MPSQPFGQGIADEFDIVEDRSEVEKSGLSQEESESGSAKSSLVSHISNSFGSRAFCLSCQPRSRFSVLITQARYPVLLARILKHAFEDEQVAWESSLNSSRNVSALLYILCLLSCRTRCFRFLRVLLSNAHTASCGGLNSLPNSSQVSTSTGHLARVCFHGI